MAAAFAAGFPVGRWKAGILTLALAIFTQAATAAEPKHVLVFYSFARDGSPMNVTVAAFRRAMAEQSPHEIAFYDADLESGLPPDSKGETAIVESLRARFASAHLDLIVTVSAAATRFYLRHRDELFGNTPVQAMGAEERTIADLPLRPGDGVVGVRSNLGNRIEQILSLLPGTRNVAVVTGDSPQERFWVDQLRKELQRFEGTITFDWLNGLSLAQMKRRVAALQEGSVVYAGMLYMDAARTPLKRMEVLEELKAISNVPIFGTYEADLGHGIVGGPLVAQVAVGKTAAKMALRSLLGDAQGQPPVVAIEPTTPPIYDWRVLHRWNIDEARLPPGSIVKFRPPSVWEEHRGTVTAAIVIVLLQTVLITALFLQRVRMRRAEREALAMSGRLMTAHEDERRRLARELHDDVTQRLARLAIDAARLQSQGRGSCNAVDTQPIGAARRGCACAFVSPASVDRGGPRPRRGFEGGMRADDARRHDSTRSGHLRRGQYAAQGARIVLVPGRSGGAAQCCAPRTRDDGHGHASPARRRHRPLRRRTTASVSIRAAHEQNSVWDTRACGNASVCWEAISASRVLRAAGRASLPGCRPR